MKKAVQRSPYWDNMKGILILLVVFAHILYQLQSRSAVIDATVDYIYMFHMPAFVFVSGYFGKSRNSQSAPAIIRLIFIYYIFNSIVGFVYGFASLLEPLYSYWYLVALIAWRITARHIAEFREINLILFIAAVFIGFYASIDNTFAASRIIAFYPYYMIGYKLAPEKSDGLIHKKYGKRLLTGIGIILPTCVLAYFAYSFFRYSDNELLMYGYADKLSAFGRVVLFIIAFAAIYAIRNICPDKKIPMLSMIGRNSLWIFILHRPVTLWLSDRITDQSVGLIMLISVLCAAAICLAFGNDLIAKHMNRFADAGAAIFTEKGAKKFSIAQLATLLVSLWFVFSIVISAYSGITLNDLQGFINGTLSEEEPESPESSAGEDVMYPVMSYQQKSEFDSAFRITFAGDLILLEDQVKRGYKDDKYDFTEVFEYAEGYISSADLAIGVFEGPMAGEAAGYTSSNYDDGKELYLNFPDEFATAVKNAGFDLVTTANNHVLDKGPDGALRTLDVLDSIGLDHIGSYRDASEKENGRIKLIECDGIKIAFLSYTYGSNYYDNSELTDGELSYVTSVISETSGELFERQRTQVEQDFEEAEKLSPDLIIVMPHIGTQFSNEPDEMQTVWFEIFKECGADIILGDHPHVVEPALIEEYDNRMVFTAYCPGNFANIYRENQGDTSMLIDVYIDRDTKEIIGGGIVPLYTQSAVDGNYRALPIYEMVNNAKLRRQLSTDDLSDAQSANDIITEVVFGQKMDIDSMTERYYFDKNGFIRMKTKGLELTDEMRNGTLYEAVADADTICFVGDSLTEGTKNGGCPWYEPIEEHMGGKTVYNYSHGGCTVSYMNEHADEIPQAERYVIAVGTNDVRYRDDKTCAMTSADYIAQIDKLKKHLAEKYPSSGFVFIAPWYSVDADPFCPLTFAEKTALNNEYSDALKEYCAENDIDFIDANPHIQDMLYRNPDSVFLLDHIHPNAQKGVIMYSEAVLLAD